jgi:hypothetical protein
VKERDDILPQALRRLDDERKKEAWVPDMHIKD